jgi:hypothetical protein
MDILKRSIFWILFLAVLAYLIQLLSVWIIIVNESFLENNTIIYGLYILIFLYYLVFYVIKPTYIKKYKLRNTLIWIFIVTSSQTFLLNNWPEGIFYGDTFAVIWVVLTILWPTNLLISKKLKKETQDKKMEVIEA